MKVRNAFLPVIFLLFAAIVAYSQLEDSDTLSVNASGSEMTVASTTTQLPAKVRAVLADCKRQTRQTLYYDPAYVRLKYPMGDVDISRGVCTDVVIRGLRAAKVDLQQLIHEDMRRNFASYPKNWGLKRPDTNIDHRRVPNIVTFLKRRNKALKVTKKPENYLPGDVVTWKLPDGRDHIGLVADVLVPDTNRFAIYHNIGRGAVLEDMLFAFKIYGHFRYFND